MVDTVLNDVTLCAIVRDEKMNPAGGIKRFIESHVPYVEQAVIVDTGSIDGTREILEELTSEYSNIKIIDHKFKGYADARNVSIRNAKTKYVLILDADELLTHEKPQNDFEVLQNFMNYNPGKKIYLFSFEHWFPEGLGHSAAHNERLFQTDLGLKYNHDCWEGLEGLDELFKDKVSVKDVSIKHFLPSMKAHELKKQKWYRQLPLDYYFYLIPDKDIPTPSEIPEFKEWKKFNRRRNKFK